MATKKTRRILSGLGAAPRRKKRGKKKASKGRCSPVSRATAVHQSGPKKGKLKAGFRFTKSGACKTSGGGKTRGKRRGRKGGRARASSRPGHIYSGNPARSAAYKKVKGTFRLKKGCSKITSGANKGSVLCSRKVGKRRKAA